MKTKIEDYEKGSIATFTGKEFKLGKPKEEDVSIIDIAWSLSNTNRWSGHASIPISIARHSTNAVLEYLEYNGIEKPFNKKLALRILLHDAHEAYLGDVSSPLKTFIPELDIFASNIDNVIFKKYKCFSENTEEEELIKNTVKHIDLNMLKDEWKENMFPTLKNDICHSQGGYDSFNKSFLLLKTKKRFLKAEQKNMHDFCKFIYLFHKNTNGEFKSEYEFLIKELDLK